MSNLNLNTEKVSKMSINTPLFYHGFEILQFSTPHGKLRGI